MLAAFFAFPGPASALPSSSVRAAFSIDAMYDQSVALFDGVDAACRAEPPHGSASFSLMPGPDSLCETHAQNSLMFHPQLTDLLQAGITLPTSPTSPHLLRHSPNTSALLPYLRVTVPSLLSLPCPSSLLPSLAFSPALHLPSLTFSPTLHCFLSPAFPLSSPPLLSPQERKRGKRGRSLLASLPFPAHPFLFSPRRDRPARHVVWYAGPSLRNHGPPSSPLSIAPHPHALTLDMYIAQFAPVPRRLQGHRVFSLTYFVLFYRA